MGKKTKQNQVAETVQENSNKTKTVESTPAPVQQKVEKKEQINKQPKENGNTQETNEEQNQKVQLFGLYFHSSKVLNTFLFFAVGMIIAPIATYFFTFNYLENIPEITKNQAQMYSGFISVGVVVLFMIGYCVIAITDETNFKYEQNEYEKLTEKEKKEISKEKITEAFEETALEHGIKEVVRKQKKPVENQDSKKKSEAPKQEVKKEETKNQKKEEPKQQAKEETKNQKKEQPKASKKEEESKSVKKEEPKSVKKEDAKVAQSKEENKTQKKEDPKKGSEKQQTSATETAKGKEKQGKTEPKKEAKGKADLKKESTQQAAPTSTQAKAATAVKVANDSSNDEWNVVKDRRNPKPVNNEESEQPSENTQKEKVQTAESDDAFIPVTNKKKK
ncbi:VMA21-like domain protein (macronuclear) [Tetrahymena thermophila SB210]|uniref:VMA21-like domain protein n=1 Tax=Tetrahymena thermophila (strain SB210) TaxID=312017 RepID=I7MA92_TETTS|nr:VMA21-like domain protein [Tetrahymena thermophila SB210]EAS03942.4 VMA21-like domain protein [Tetrahymena thermophila SB210]|eukprot:XP_001024187.4 VMA21-like domain protein [Tetrahymena thermophila SB210]